MNYFRMWNALYVKIKGFSMKFKIQNFPFKFNEKRKMTFPEKFNVCVWKKKVNENYKVLITTNPKKTKIVADSPVHFQKCKMLSLKIVKRNVEELISWMKSSP